MSVFDLFRRFFQPPGMRDPFFGGMTHDDDDDDEDDGGEEYRGDPFWQPHVHGFESPFWQRSQPFHDPFGFEDIFRDFNELFADFGSMIQDVPQLPGVETPVQGPGRSSKRSLRDSMLKYPDSHLPREQTPSTQGPSSQEGPHRPTWGALGDNSWEDAPLGDAKQDKILDSEVSSGGLDSILRSREPPSSSFFRSISVAKISRPDGTVEERRTVHDEHGKASTTVTVTRDGQVISSETIDPSRGGTTGDYQDFISPRPRPLPDLSDSQGILSRFFPGWFSDR